MSADLEKLREIFLTDVDDETKAENLGQIRAWEKALTSNEEYQGWREHDVTRRIAAEARKTYADLSVQLATNRSLTPEQRISIYARQDAMAWLLSLSERDAKEVMAQIQADIRRALAAAS